MTESEIFAEALLRPNKALRAAFLDEACGPDKPLRERMDRLLALHESERPLLGEPPAEMLAALVGQSAKRDPERDREAAGKQLAAYLAPACRPGALGRLGHYEVLQVLGHGGFGIVVKAHDDSLQRLVAIKILAPHLAATSPPRQRFLREARAAAAVRYEHVVQIYGVEEQPLPYLVMEFIEGQTLQQKLDATGPLAAAEVVQLGQQIARGLAAAHEKGLIHRDVKPANILLEAGVEPRVKLTDFGLARAADDASLTQSGVLAGSPMYMAPEQASGAVLDHRADLFSLGSVLYTMTTGRPPFRAPNTLAVLKRVADDAPRPIREVMSDVPEGLCAVIMRLLQKKPDDRYATAREAAEALARCLTAPAPVTVPLPRRFARRRLVYAAAAVLLLGAAGVWGAYQITHPHQPKQAPPPPAVEPPAPSPAGFVVTSVLDDGSTGTLRWAVTQANLHHGEDTITFDPTVFAASQTIALVQGPLVLLDPAQTTITGPAGGLTVSGGDKSQVFVIGAGYEVSNDAARALIADVTIAKGRPTDEFPFGGGVLCRGGATLTLTGCTIRDNAALDHDGGGGGVYNHRSTVVLTNCTLTRNEAKGGGAIKNYAGVVRVTNCTIVGNSDTAESGGIFTLGSNRPRTEVNNSILANSGGRNLYLGDDLDVTGDYNLTSDDSAPGPHSQLNADARLGPLGRYGGPTETVPLLTGSPAIDAGDNDRVPPPVHTDQRGSPRVVNGKVDIGAFEAR